MREHALARALAPSQRIKVLAQVRGTGGISEMRGQSRVNALQQVAQSDDAP
jgi:phosphoribosylamine-glycine ligase